ncbi:MAG: DNA mismatch repair endonuclease MutL [Bacteroidota bacterium]
MQQLIHLLPDALANQIAAGEVVQRPASVVKELLENAVDAGATRIDLFIKQAGKQLIQVSDNGQGMSTQDARMAFERHATSKIRKQDDLFGIRTLGFRGEALASIAAVAQVRLRTRLVEEEIGIELDIEASEVKRVEPHACKHGSTFQVKNLFFNVPARRNFLKSNPVETRHILNEFIRVSLSHPEIHLTFTHNDTEVYDLAGSSLEARLYALFGKELQGKLINVEEATGYVTISGFLGSPVASRKDRKQQFFFVNGRYIRSNYLNHAIATAYEDYLPKDSQPIYCIFLEIDPVHVDINIHPTKTEVKFDDERTLYVLLQSIVKRGLGELHAAPGLELNPDQLTRSIYESKPIPPAAQRPAGRTPNLPQKNPSPRKVDWDALYAAPEPVTPPKESQPQLFSRSAPSQSASKETVSEGSLLVQLENRYLLHQREHQLLIIDQQLAHQRILYERFLQQQGQGNMPCQQLLFPQNITLTPEDLITWQQVNPLLEQMGFEIKAFGRDAIVVYGMPTGLNIGKLSEVVAQILAEVAQSGGSQADNRWQEQIARAIAWRSAIASPHPLSPIEMRKLVQDLFRCQVPGFAPNGKPTIKRISLVELEEYFR